MKRALKQLSDVMWSVIADTKCTRLEKIECAKVILSCHGCLMPDVNEKFLSVRQIVTLRALKQHIVEQAIKRKAIRKRQNRRAFLRRKLRAIEAAPTEEKNEQRS